MRRSVNRETDVFPLRDPEHLAPAVKRNDAGIYAEARKHAARNASDPYAYGRAVTHLRNGIGL